MDLINSQCMSRTIVMKKKNIFIGIDQGYNIK